MADIIHSKGEAGGYLVGNRHTEGGIKAINKSTGQPLEMEGGEVVITRNAVSDTTKRSFNGKMMTNREILSSINKSGGGVEFEEGGEVPSSIEYVDALLEYDGEQSDSRKVLEKMAVGGQVSDILDDLKDIYDQGGVAPQLEPLRQLKTTTYFAFTDTNGLNKDMSLTRGLLSIPKLLEEYLLSFSNGAFSLVVKTRLYTDNNEEKVDVTVSYNYSDIGIFTYSFFRDSIIRELKNNILFTKPFEDLYYQANKLYCTGLKSTKILTNTTTVAPIGPGTFAQVFALYQKDYDLDNYDYEPENEFDNFQSFEKIGKKLIAKKVTNLVLKSNLVLNVASANYENNNFASTIVITTDDFVNGKGLPKKWNWWKENIFSKQGMFSQKLGELSFVDFLDDVDFGPFECERVNFRQKKRSTAQKQLREKLISKGSDANEIYVNNFQDTSGEIISPPFELTFSSRSRFDVYANISYDILRLGKISSEVRFDAEQTLFAGEEGIFHFGFRNNVIFTFDKEKAEREKLERAELERLEKEKRAEERKQLQEEQRLEEEKQLAFKNRPFKVRDQQKDLDFFPLEAAKGAFREEIRALKIMLNFTGTEKLRDERALIVQKISALERKDVKLALKELNRRPGETLMSPENLLEYYFTQATQSPIVQLGPPCGKSTPTGAPSKLPLQSYEAVRTSFFKSWFGDWEMAYANQDYKQCSMLVDEETAEPKMMYHGVRQKIEGLTTGNMGSGINRPYAEFSPPNFPATYFGDSIDYVKFYAGEAENQPKPTANYEGYIYNVFIKMQNPVILVGLGLNNSYRELLVYIYLNYGVKIEPSTKYSTLFNTPGSNYKVWNYIRYDINLIEKLKSAGYDGIIQLGDVPAFDDNQAPKEENLLGSEYLVFSAEQIKDASIKNSFYLPFIKDIRFKEGGNVRL